MAVPEDNIVGQHCRTGGWWREPLEAWTPGVPGVKESSAEKPCYYPSSPICHAVYEQSSCQSCSVQINPRDAASSWGKPEWVADYIQGWHLGEHTAACPQLSSYYGDELSFTLKYWASRGIHVVYEQFSCQSFMHNTYLKKTLPPCILLSVTLSCGHHTHS